MTLQEHTLSFEGTVESALRKCVNGFTADPMGHGKQMRQLLEYSRPEFQAAALVVLNEAREERGYRYLITLLWTHELLVPILTDCTIPTSLGVRVACVAAKVDPQLHIRLTRYLHEHMLETRKFPENSGTRLLEILRAISDPGSLAPLLRQILLHPSVKIRSKVGLLIGGGHAGASALQSLLHDEDARVRANAVEALWNNPDSHAIEIFVSCLHDPSNRVAGNAILGLYLAGDTRGIPRALALLEHPDSRYRATAIWIIGKTLDPRFIPFVARLLIGSKGQLRQLAFRTLESLKKASLGRAKAPLSLSILSVNLNSDGETNVSVSVGSAPSARPVQSSPPTSSSMSVRSL